MKIRSASGPPSMGRLPSSKSESGAKCGALVINDPLAPPHTATGIASLVSGISGAKILAAKRHSEPAPALGQSGACGQNRCASDENQFETEEGLQHPGRNAAARPFVPTRAGAGFLVQRTARKTARSFAIRTNQSAVDRAGIGSRIGQVRCQLAPPAAVEWDSLRCIEAIALSVEVDRHLLGL